jgi:hypothetical protein
MPAIDLSILNQRQTPAFYADVFANRPAAGFVGRIFVSTNTFAFYRDNGTGWDLIGGPGTGTVTGSGTTGQVTFWDGASTITGDSGLTYNGTTNALTSLGTITSTNYYVGTPTDLTRSFAAKGNANTVALWLEEYGATTASPDIFMYKGQGSSSAPSNILVGDSTGAIATGGYVNGSLKTTSSLFNRVVNIDTTNNQADTDLIVEQTYNSVTAVENFRVRSSDGYVVAPNGGFETTGNINLFAGANTRRIVFDANNGIPRIFSFRTGNLPRWAFRVDGTETGSSTGADLAIRRYDDAGAFVDAPLSINRASGQSTFVKKVIINNNTGDDQLQIVSTTAPSLRIDNAVTGATKRAGLGIATAANNFIQGSVDRDYCIFNGSTTASPILFGVYDAGAGNTQEAARISPARNFIVGSVVDNGQKLQINGTSRFSGFAFVNHSTASSYGAAIYNTNVNGEGLAIRGGSTSSHSSLLVQTYDGNIELFKVLANGYVGIGSGNPDIFSRFYDRILGVNSSTGIAKIEINGSTYSGIDFGQSGTRYAEINGASTGLDIGTTTNTPIQFFTNGSYKAILTGIGNLLLNTGTDNGNKLQINGNQSINGGLRFYDFIGATANYWDCYQYNDNTLRFNYNGSGGDEFVLFNNGNLEIGLGSIKTASPSGGSAQTWKLGNYTAGAAVQAGKVRVEINGVAYDLLTA